MKSNANKITKKHRIIFSLSMAIALTATATVGGVLGYALHKSKQNNPVTPPAPVDKKLIMTATNNNLEYDSYNTVSTIYATYTDSDESPASFTSNENIKLTIADTIYNNKYFQFHDNGDGSGVLTMTAGIPSVGSVKHVDIQAKDTAGLSSDYIIDLMPNKKNPEPIPTPQIALSNDNPTLQFDQQGDHESNILVSVNTGGTPTLTASGNDEGTYWTFNAETKVVKMEQAIPYTGSRIVITITATYPGADDQTTTITLLPNFSHTIQIDADNHVLQWEDQHISHITATCSNGNIPKLRCECNGDNSYFTFDEMTGTLTMVKSLTSGIISVNIIASCHDAVEQSITITLTHDHVDAPTIDISASNYQLSSQILTSAITASASDGGTPNLSLDDNTYCSLNDNILTLNNIPADYITVKVTATYTNTDGTAVPQSVEITLIPDSPIPDHYQTTPSKGVLENLNDVVTLVTTNNGTPVDATYTTTSIDVTITNNVITYSNEVKAQQTITINAAVNGEVVSYAFITLQPHNYIVRASVDTLQNVNDTLVLTTTDNNSDISATYTASNNDYIIINDNVVTYAKTATTTQSITIYATVNGVEVGSTEIYLDAIHFGDKLNVVNINDNLASVAIRLDHKLPLWNYRITEATKKITFENGAYIYINYYNIYVNPSMASNPNTDKLTIGGGHYEGRAEMFFVDENGNKTQLETSYYSPGTDFVIPTDNDNPSSYVIATQDASWKTDQYISSYCIDHYIPA